MEKKLIIHGKDETVDDIVDDIMAELFDDNETEEDKE